MTVRQSESSDTLPAVSYIAGPDLHWYWLLLRLKGWSFLQIAQAWNTRDDRVRRALHPLMSTARRETLLRPRRAFAVQRCDARKRRIPWDFTFAQWWAVWDGSGKWTDRGTHRGQYVMARHGDTGAYSPTNVRICLSAENTREGLSNWRQRRSSMEAACTR